MQCAYIVIVPCTTIMDLLPFVRISDVAHGFVRCKEGGLLRMMFPHPPPFATFDFKLFKTFGMSLANIASYKYSPQGNVIVAPRYVD